MQVKSCTTRRAQENGCKVGLETRYTLGMICKGSKHTDLQARPLRSHPPLVPDPKVAVSTTRP